jgi:glutaminyl-tRNA synthetase
MGVLDPIRLVITNYPEGEVEEFDVPNSPEDASLGRRTVPFSRELYIEREDYLEVAPKKWHRLSPGREVRLRYAYLVTCQQAIKDPDTGEVVELRCTYDPESRGGSPKDGRKVRGTLHWVSQAHARDAEVRLYDRLFTKVVPGEGDVDYKEHLNPESKSIKVGCKVEPALAAVAPGHVSQFERVGYFCADLADHSAEHLVFNRTIALRDSWAKVAGKGGKAKSR